MADIKINQTAEQAAAGSERLAAGDEKFKKSPERAVEAVEVAEAKKIEQSRQDVIKEINRMENGDSAAAGPVGGIISQRAKRQKEIESVMSSGLEDVYLSLTPAKRREFKKAGELAAAKINGLLEKVKLNLGEIVKLIKKWLALIPGVNKYFLEQEAKIKADEIVKMRNK
ncbi:MAG: hypothetical protein Q8O93_05875 [bacterium]|nr:hypothetical protein [bacterium]